MKDRIILLRKSLKLNQTQFGKKLGLSRSAVANLELGRVSPAEHIIKHLASTFCVNEEWLRTGTGNMRVVTEDAIFQQFSNEYNLDDVSGAAILAFAKLPEHSRSLILTALRSISSACDSAESDFDRADRIITEQLNNAR